MICMPMLDDLSHEGIDILDIFKLLEEKYLGEVVTNDRFNEAYKAVKEVLKK